MRDAIEVFGHYTHDHEQFRRDGGRAAAQNGSIVSSSFGIFMGALHLDR
jgi:hypothetical protein